MHDRRILEDEILMTTLSGGASYCEFTLNHKPRRVVVLAGHPIEFKTFCLIATGFMAGSTSAYQYHIDEALVKFWEELGRPGKYPQDAVQHGDAFGFFEAGTVSKPHYYMMINLLSKAAEPGSDGKKANYLPLLAEISRLAATVR